MEITTLAGVIQTILAPAVLVSACAILQIGLLTHYTAINERMRHMVHERFELKRGAQPTDGADHIALIDAQLPTLLNRHRLVNWAVLTVYLAVILFLVDIIIVTLTVTSTEPALALSVLVTFLIGVVVLLAGIAITAGEVLIAFRAVQFEVVHNFSAHKKL
ncbi:MAG: DUF2721 domain-containing protein [Caldilineaceae bacterium]